MEYGCPKITRKKETNIALIFPFPSKFHQDMFSHGRVTDRVTERQKISQLISHS